jgi:CPA2 family monovalent cation:H+ antiporter-2
MTPEPVFFRDLAYVFAAAVLGGILARLARQPLIIGYVVGGILISPFTPGPAVAHMQTFELFAEVGVVLLMYSIGIEFSLRDLLRVKWVALLGGPLGVVLSIGLGTAVGIISGWPPVQAMVVGMVISIASTMVLARLLMDRDELRSSHGRVLIGITLVEDLAVVVLTILVSALGALHAGRLVTLAAVFGKAALVLVPFTWLAAKVIPRVLTRVARTQNEELFLLVALAIGLGTAALTQAVGLSLAVGAFLAGLVISNSDHAHETMAHLLPMRDAFVALFFVTIGALLNPATVLANLSLLAVMVGLVVGGNFIVWTAVVRLFGHPWRTAMLVGTGLTQIGEFSFILVQAARTAGHVGEEVYNATLATSLITILINAALVRSVPGWIESFGIGRLKDTAPWPEEDGRRGRVVVCGFGRIGGALGRALATFDIPYAVIERDPDIASDLRNRGVPVIVGDASHRELLLRARVDRAALVVVTIPDVGAARLAVRSVRVVNPGARILARAHQRTDADLLRQDGATEVVEPEVEAAAVLIVQMLEGLHVSRDLVLDYVARFRGAPPPQIAFPSDGP